VGVWLTFLNATEVEATATFPGKLEGWFGPEPGAVPVQLEVRNPTDPGTAVVQPGRFVRREYLLSVPRSVEGRQWLTVAFESVNPVTIDVRKPVPGAPAVTKEDSLLLRFFKDGSSQGFDPVRFFKDHISGYDPLYFIAGTESPNAKFQVSFKYQLVNNDGALGRWLPPTKGLHFAYSQTSLWDWNGESAPFFDSSYRPELLYAWERLAGGSNDWFRLDLQGGAQHESNGKGGLDSRSLNIAYLKPTLTLGRPGTIQLTLAPRVWVYVGDLDDNPDLKDYRGYGDLRAVVGWSKGLQLSALGRLGDDGNRGSVQLDLTYPMMKLLSESFSVYLHAQYFIGYGESLLLYNERGTSFRVGFSFYR
jgi:outer membrane phospholipase A